MSSSRDLRGTWPQALGSLATAILLILGLRWALFEPYVIPSGSMIPTLLVHDHILVNKFAYGLRLPFSSRWLIRFRAPSRGEVIVFKSVASDGVFLVKRVIGLPGDEISFDETGALVINGLKVTERRLDKDEVSIATSSWPALEREAAPARFEFLEEKLPEGRTHLIIREPDRNQSRGESFKVPQDSIFMLGDNRNNSADSRIWGALPMESILGTPIFIWLACEETLAESNQVCDPETVRWDRIFERIQ